MYFSLVFVLKFSFITSKRKNCYCETNKIEFLSNFEVFFLECNSSAIYMSRNETSDFFLLWIQRHLLDWR